MRFRWKLNVLIAMLVAAAAFVVVPLAIADPPPENVGICHRTGSEANPYVFIATDNSAIIAAHVTSEAHPALNGREDYFGVTRAECAAK